MPKVKNANPNKPSPWSFHPTHEVQTLYASYARSHPGVTFSYIANMAWLEFLTPRVGKNKTVK